MQLTLQTLFFESKMAIRVVELFAGVGGFRIGLEGYPRAQNSQFQVIWSNQWEPSTKSQGANVIYKNRWPFSPHSEIDIAEVSTNEIPEHDLLVGGFPCQDYSVATSLKNSKGLIGKKGVLWWQIYRILEEKGKSAPKYLLLENVDRLLKSPAKQRGRDFAVILASLQKLGYAVEWRVINAAEYGMPQRRRRVFILAYKQGTPIYESMLSVNDYTEWLVSKGIIAEAFPITGTLERISTFCLSNDLANVSKHFGEPGSEQESFENTGFMINGEVTTAKATPEFMGTHMTLKDALQPLHEVGKEFYIDESALAKWQYMKGAKKERRFNESGNFWYDYSEGGMVFPDPLDSPSRTIITGEGGNSPSRFKHVVKQDGVYRRLTPIELERLNMFPDDHTNLPGISNTRRAFFMGNALVVGVIQRLGEALSKRVGTPSDSNALQYDQSSFVERTDDVRHEKMPVHANQ